jgi:hypothetical protein
VISSDPTPLRVIDVTDPDFPSFELTQGEAMAARIRILLAVQNRRISYFLEDAMTRRVRVCLAVTLACGGLTVGVATAQNTHSLVQMGGHLMDQQSTPLKGTQTVRASERIVRTEPRAGGTALVEQLGNLPLSFEANHGQADKRAQFISRGLGYSLFLTSTEAVLALQGPAEPDRSPKTSRLPGEPESLRTGITELRMDLLGSNPQSPAAALDQLSSTSNYFIGNDPRQWQTNIPNYGKVRFENVYAGVDLVYYGNQNQLEYDFIVAPGADPGTIRLGFTGAERMRIDSHGELTLPTRTGDVRWHKPVIYQEIDGVRRIVSGRYVRKGKTTVGFAVAPYDPRHVLVIDPTLDYSTYLGATGVLTNGIAVDSNGKAYVTGSATSIGMATGGAFQVANGGGQDAFVMKFDTSRFGNATRVYSTYIGGNGTDAGNSIAVDSLGNAYITGTTGSLNFPTSNAYQGAFQGGPGGLDAFVTKLNAAGNALLYSTYLGGDNNDVGTGIAVNSSTPPDGYVYVTGNAISSNFPTLNGFRSSGYGFVAKLNTLASGVPSLVYSTYLDSDARAIAVDSSGHAYVTGRWGGVDAVPDICFVPFCPTGPDAFVMKIDTTASGLTSLMYATYVGGSGDDIGLGIAVDSSGNAYVTGETNSIDFPGTSFSTIAAGVAPIQGTNHGGKDAFVFELNKTGQGLVYSTYLGGTGDEQGSRIAVDSSGNAYVAGATNSPGFPTSNALAGQSSLSGSSAAFVTKINASGTDWVYSTYLGGNNITSASSIALDSSGNAYVTGNTNSSNFPITPNAFQFNLSGSGGFLAKIIDDTTMPPTISVSPTSLYFSATDAGANPVDQNVAISNAGGGTLNWTANVVTGGSWLSVSPVGNTGTLAVSVNIVGLAAGTYNGSIQVTDAAATNTPQTIAVQLLVNPVTTSATLTSSLNPSTPGQSVTFTAIVLGVNPTGMTTFLDGGTTIGVASLVGGSANFTTNALTGGSHSITASYSGDSNNLDSISPILVQTVNLGPPTIAKAFGVSSIPLGTNTTLTFTLTNPNAIAVTGVSFIDPLPDGLIVAVPNGLTGSCGGTVTATANTSLIVLSGGSIAGNGTCIFTVTVTGVSVGSWINTTSGVTFTQGGMGGTATANLQVSAPLPGCQGSLKSAYALQYGGLAHAAAALGFPSVSALVNYVAQVCGG